MNKLSKDKRNQLVLIIMATVGIVAGIYLLAIRAQQAEIQAINASIEKTVSDIDKMEQVKKSSAKIEEQLAECQSKLAKIEGTMPSGDLYLWVNSTMRKFNVPGYHVEIPGFGAPVVSAMPLIPAFPYNQLSIAITGSAYYDDLGQWMADFENQFPCMRIQNVSLEPGTGATPEEREKLTFHFEILSLTRPNLP